MNPYVDIAYARLNLDFNHKLFALEYDKLIYPWTKPIYNDKNSWQRTRGLNQTWRMVDPDTYDKCSIEVDYGQFDPRELPQWQMAQLMYLETVDSDLEVVKTQTLFGGTYARNLALDRDWKIKPKFEKLKIIEFIKNLPLTNINSIHCVSLEPGSFASIHRDSRWFDDALIPNVAAKNGVRQQGFVVVTLNVSDGGAPLYWAFDDHYVDHAYKANDPVYLCSDYFLHGVPVCTSRRRQIRVTGRPTPEFAKLIDAESAITIPTDMEYAVGDKWYPG